MLDFIANNALVTGIIGAVLLLIMVAYLIVQRVKVAGPNEAFIITGRKGQPVRNPETGEVSTDMSGQKVVMGAMVFVLPFVQRLHVMSLASRRISVGIAGAVSAQGIKTNVEGVAIVKVGGNEDAIRAAAQRFLNQQEGIEQFTQEVLAGSLRAIVGRLTVDEIIKDRAAFASAVAEEAETSLTNQGLALDTFQLQDIQAEGDYLVDLGRPEAARVKQDADIAEAKARQASEQERLRVEEEIANAERKLDLRRAEIRAETDAANARAAAAGPLQEAARDQEVIAEQERVAERQAQLTDRRLDSEVRKPADAARYRVETEAEGRKNAAIFDADAEKARRARMAEAVEIEGRSEAEAIRARGEAEADARRMNAEAFKLYNDAAIIELITQILPEVVRGAAEPISAVERMTVISTDGASQLTRNVASNLEQGLQVGSDLTGLDLRSLLSRLGKSGDSSELAGAVERVRGAATPRPGEPGASRAGEPGESGEGGAGREDEPPGSPT